MPREINQVLKTAVQAHDAGIPVINDLPSFQNINADKNAAIRLVYIDEPITSNVDVKKSGVIKEEFPIRCLFIARDVLVPDPGATTRQARFDATQEQHDLVINEMRTLAKQTLVNLMNQKYENMDEIQEITGVEFMNVRNEFNANLSGVAVTMTIKLTNGDSLCPSV